MYIYTCIQMMLGIAIASFAWHHHQFSR